MKHTSRERVPRIDSNYLIIYLQNEVIMQYMLRVTIIGCFILQKRCFKWIEMESVLLGVLLWPNQSIYYRSR